MTSRASPRAAPEGAATDRGRRLRAVALATLLACVGARGLLSEVPYAVSTLKTPPPTSEQAPTVRARPANPRGLLRVGLACVLLAAAALWLAAEARAGAIEIRHKWLAALMGAFALWSLASVFGAADRHAAWTAWIEQVALMAACFTAAQMCRRLLGHLYGQGVTGKGRVLDLIDRILPTGQGAIGIFSTQFGGAGNQCRTTDHGDETAP